VDENHIGEAILGCAIKVHKALGPGLLESAYEACLAHEFENAMLSYKRQVVLPVFYDGRRIDAGYRLDLLVEDHVVVEGEGSRKDCRNPSGASPELLKTWRLSTRISAQFQCAEDEGRHLPTGEWPLILIILGDLRAPPRPLRFDLRRGRAGKNFVFSRNTGPPQAF
jgi:hypothetical protein